jgi:nitrogen fixation NifU-like protein
LKGKTVAEARALFAQFHTRVTGGEPGDPPEALQDDVERLEPLAGVKAFPVRIKCATLPWHAFEAALKSGLAGNTVKTE